MLLSTTNNFVFWHIPKTAGISIRSMLKPYATTSADDYMPFVNSTLLDPLHINQQDFLNLNMGIIPGNYFEFVVVRNPLDRLISMYNYGNNSERFGSFGNFAQRVAMHYRHCTMSNFYNSQLDWIKHPLTDKVYVYRFENLDNELNDICTKIKVDKQPLVHYNKSVNVAERLSAREVEFCKDLLAEEYEVLNYQGENNE